MTCEFFKRIPIIAEQSLPHGVTRITQIGSETQISKTPEGITVEPLGDDLITIVGQTKINETGHIIVIYGKHPSPTKSHVHEGLQDYNPSNTR